ncbi:pheromone-regulated protein prm10 [Basidiobolus ranarum]|uniref:Pheromone-regulated protein prm10 n=1 Tax=Basidiobolus ranarum TaxID=34480 RepID=A0ABR2W7B4_9FUNG
MGDDQFDEKQVNEVNGDEPVTNEKENVVVLNIPTLTIDLSPTNTISDSPIKRGRTLRKKKNEAKKMVKNMSDHQSQSTGGILSQLLRLNNVSRSKKSPKLLERRANSSSSLTTLVQNSSNFLGLQSNRSSVCYDNVVTPLTLEERMNITVNIADILLKQDYLLLLSRCMVKFGSPAHRLEQNMARNSQALNVNSNFVFLPGVALITFGDKDTHTSDTHIIKVDREYDMGKLERVYKISRCLVHEEVDLEEAFERLEEIMAEPPTWPWWVHIINYGLCSFFVAPLCFNGSWIDALVSGLIGLCIGALSVISAKIYNYANVFEISATVVTALVATALHNYVCYTPVILSSIVLLLPGLSFTTSVIELASRNTISGVIRLVFSLIVSFMLGFGLNMGANLWKAAGGVEVVEQSTCYSVSPYWYFLLCPPLAITYSIYLNASWRQWPPMMILSIIGFTVSYFTNQITDVSTSSAISTFFIALVGNLYSRITHRFGYASVLGATIMLVPGSLGVRGIVDVFNHSSQGVNLAFEMIVISMSMSVGLFIGTLIVYPLGKKRTSMMMF